MLAAPTAEARRQIGDETSCEMAGQAVQQLITEPPAHGRLRLCGARTDDQVVLTQSLHESARIGRRMLSIGVDDEYELALSSADAGLDGRAVALGVGMAYDVRSGPGRPRSSLVAGSIVNDEDLSPGRLGSQRGDDVADGVFFVQRRNDD